MAGIGGDVAEQQPDERRRDASPLLGFRERLHAGKGHAGTQAAAGGGVGVRSQFPEPRFERGQPIVLPQNVRDRHGDTTELYPANPNGSPNGIAAITTSDGRITVIMPHPERVFRTVQMSWHPPEWGEDSPWMRMFRNARVWVG